MAGRALWGWILIRGAKHPLVATLWLGLFFWLPLVEALRPVPGAGGPGSLASWFVPVGALAALLALLALSGEEPFLRRLDPTDRLAGELGALALAIAIMQLPMALGAWIFGAWTLDSLRLVPDILSLDARLASLGLVVLALPLRTAARAGLLLATVWPLAALATGAPPRAALLLDPAFALRSTAWTGALASGLVAGAGVLVAATLRTARGGAA